MSTTTLDFYEKSLTELSFIPCENIDRFNLVGKCFKLSPDVGQGVYWIYHQKDLFNIKIHDFFFHEDLFLEFNLPESLNITKYDSISGEEINPYRRISANCVKTFIGRYEPYKLLVHKKVPIKSIGIEVYPAYYESYLKKQYPNEYENPLSAFLQIDETANFPAVTKLLYQIQNYRGEGFASKLFYESKVAEIMSLVIENSKKNKKSHEKKLSEKDIKMLKDVTAYLNDHYAYDIPLECLAKIACMGTTKLKITFKQFHKCTITEYIQHRRIGQAEHLLLNTNLSIGQISQTVGYKNASRFAELFRKSTGMLPTEFRKYVK